MKKRIAYLIAFFAMVLGCFLIQKPLFMLYNDAVEKGVSPADFGRVILHGFTLDATTAGYLTVIPWLVVLISIWFRQFPLRKILTGYYVLISFLVMLIFIVDMALYPFWGFKLDASIFLYMDSPKKCTGKRFYGIHYLTHLYHAAFISSDDGRFIQTDSSKTGWY